MKEVDKISGLPKDLFDIGEISKEQQKIKIRAERRRFKKIITIVEGIEDEKTAKELGKEMKRKFACGGTVKDKGIELQGDHKKRAKEFLIKRGYKENQIEI